MRVARLSLIAFVTGLFTGYSPFAPGTAGSLLAVGFLYFVPLPGTYHVALCLFLLFAGAAACEKANRLFGKADASKIVIDEIVGILVTMIGLPLTGYWLVVGFFAFRFFDIVKLPPANYFDAKLKNGWGVMLDDVTAGIYASVLLHLMLRASF